MLKQVIELYELLDRADTCGEVVRKYLQGQGASNIEVIELKENGGSSDFIRVIINGSDGKSNGGSAPTLGITGRLGGLGARPDYMGFVSDGDGALAALALAGKILTMNKHGEFLKGDVVISTHICPCAPTIEHFPVRLMSSYVNMETINKLEVQCGVDAVLSCDTTKGNKILNHNGFAITCTTKEGYILRVSDDLCDIMMRVTGKMPVVLPISQQDITPYGNGLYHINSIMQPAVATDVPVVGVAITTEVPVAGCATGSTHLTDVERAATFMFEVAKDYMDGRCSFYDADEFSRIKKQYGSMKHFQLKDLSIEKK